MSYICKCIFILDLSICFKHHLTCRNSKLMANSKFPALAVDNMNMTRIDPCQFYNLPQSFILPSLFLPNCSSFCLQFPCYTNWAKITEGDVWQFDNKTHADVIVSTQTIAHSLSSKLHAHNEEPPAAQQGVAPGEPGLLLRVRVAALPHCGGVH